MNLHTFIHTTWGSVGKDGTRPRFFPGPQPISIERKHMPMLRRKPYLVCEKTDGTRISLVCYGPDIVLVDRKMAMTPVKLRVPPSASKGTILDGEYVTARDGKDYYMVYDAVMVSGELVKHKSLHERIESATSFVKKIMKTTKDTFRVKVKTFYTMDNIGTIVNKVRKDEFHYNNDGLVFTPDNEPVKIGTHKTMFKWKPRDHNTIDFLVKHRRDGTIGLYIQEHGELIFESLITQDKKTIGMKENCIAECQYQTESWPRWWKPLNIRTDKTHPNNRITLSRTMVNIEENIKIDEFL